MTIRNRRRMSTGKTDSQATNKRRKERRNMEFDIFICHTIGVNKMPQYLKMN
jgi:hypothetical protein